MKSREVRKQQPEYNEAEQRLRAKMEQEDTPPAEEDTASAAEPDAAPAEAPLAPEAQRVAELEAECESLKDQALRARAEFDNYRKRTAREQDRFRATATESIIHDLLPVVDNLELALKHSDSDAQGVIRGVEMVLKQMRDALSNHGLNLIPAHGERFDPNVHEAVGQQPSDSIPVDHVVEEYQRGYFLGDVVLRPSRVLVSQGNDDAPNETNNETDASSPEGSDTEQGA